MTDEEKLAPVETGEGLPDWHAHDYWRTSKNGHKPGTPEYSSETVKTNEGVFYRWQLLQIHP